MGNERQDLVIGSVYIMLRRDYGHLPTKEVHWPKIVQELEERFKTEFSSSEVAWLVFFFAQDEKDADAKYREALTNRT